MADAQALPLDSSMVHRGSHWNGRRVRHDGTLSAPLPAPITDTQTRGSAQPCIRDSVSQAASLYAFWVCWDNSTGISADRHPLKGHGEWVCTFVGTLGISAQHQNMGAFFLRVALEWEGMAEGGRLQWLPSPWC